MTTFSMPEADALPGPRSPDAGWRGIGLVFLGMAAWIVAGFLGALLAAGTLGTGAVLVRMGVPGLSMPKALGYVLVGATGFQGTLLLGALLQGRRAGAGSAWVGLGAGPIRRKWVVARLCGLMLLWLLVFMLLLATYPALRAFVKSVTPDVLKGGGGDSVAFLFARIFLVAVLAPLSEELFFRGWLWEALRRRGVRPAMTACATAIPWLLLHGIDSPWRIAMLVPAALIFSLARLWSGSVRGSLAVHVTNNGAAVLIQTLTSLLGREA